MTVPGIVEDALGGAEVLSRVSLSGDDELFVTAGRTLCYRAGGVLSDESVEAYPHDVEGLRVREGRRKAAVVFQYAVEDDLELSIRKADLEAVLQPLLASVLRATGATDPDERVQSAFRFSELTVVVTGERLLKHVGSALWDGEFEAFHFADVTGLEYERGDVATGIVLTVDGRKERIKAPNDRVPAVRRALESALFSYRDVDDADELAGEADEDDTESPDADSVESFGAGIDPLDAGADGANGAPAAVPGSDADDRETSGEVDDREANGDEGSAAETGAAGDTDRDPDPKGDDTSDAEDPATPFTESFDPAPEDRYGELSEEVADLREAVERQNELLDEQRRAIERLVEELRD